MERHRIDHWLKLVCLFKQRTEATDACKGGLVKLNGQRVKPSAPVHEGDVIEFTQGDRPRRVVISALPAGSVSKEVARTMYVDESPEYKRPERVAQAAPRERGSGRPTKRDRREMEEWRRR